MSRKMSAENNVYETERSLEIYLLFHYGSREETMSWEFGPQNGLEFPKRCAQLCLKFWNEVGANNKGTIRALDIGCAVGRSTFELSRTFDQVLGLDYSHRFVDTAKTLARQGQLPYRQLEQGQIYRRLVARVAPDIDRSKCKFIQGDACRLPADLGQFDLVLAANLICRLDKPREFLERMKQVVKSRGLLVITSPYSFHTQYTKTEDMIGGLVNEDGSTVTALQGLTRILSPEFKLLHQEELPFSIKETARYHQWTVAHSTVWQRN